jgi:phage terminase large subunit-like protein
MAGAPRRVSPGKGKKQPAKVANRGKRLLKPRASTTVARKSFRADRNIRWIEQYCRVPEGRLVGQPVKLRSWQRDELRKIYDNPKGTRRAIVSFGRKNGKTALAAFLCLLHLCGPEAKANSQLFSAAQSRDQAGILFSLAAKVVRLSPELSAVVTPRDTRKELYCAELGTLYRALSAEASTAYGLSPVFIVHDELGQVRGPRSELYEALETATAAQENPLSIVISTQAPNPDDLLSILIDDAKTGADKRVVLSIYAAPEDAEPFEEATIRLANPAFGDFQNADEVLAMAEDARRMPSREPEYRNLILNQRVEMKAPFISRSVWQGCGSEVAKSFEGLPVYGGLDLASVSDLAAKVYVAAVGSKWHVKPTFWLPQEGLREKSRSDRVPYDLWAKDGFLRTTPGRTIEYEFVAANLFEDFERLDIRKIAFDRWNWKHLRPWLLKAGFSADQLDGDHALFEQFGQGYQSMSPALRDLESALLDGRVAHENHPVLTMCAANAVVTSDPAGNRKLDKSKATGRIDGMVALAMAMGVAETHEPVRAPSYQVMFV